jgi:membrane associated rhomboid family serine protease
MATCYRHPDRETGVSCSSCGRPICPDCMTPTPVGMRCPECARQRTPVTTAAQIQRSDVPRVTYTLIALNVVAFVVTFVSGGSITGLSGSVAEQGALFGPGVDNGDYWRLITGGFLHSGILHLALNMYFLYVLGRLLEPAIGPVRFLTLYIVSLLAGSFGALLLDPTGYTVGASGAVFGLMGAAIVEMWARGIDPWRSGLGFVLIANLALTFFIPGISIGGHLGGLIGGVIAAFVLEQAGRRNMYPAGVVVCAVLAAAAVAASIAVAGGGGLG